MRGQAGLVLLTERAEGQLRAAHLIRCLDMYSIEVQQ